MNNLKCIRCIEDYIRLSDEEKASGAAWSLVGDAVTLVPSWQTEMAGPGQLVMACVTVPVCLGHIRASKPSPEQIAQRNGLFLPGQN
jgi:hypothetical protein